MPIIFKSFLDFSKEWFNYQIFQTGNFSGQKSQCILYVSHKSILQICNKISYPAGTFFLCAVFYVNHMCDHSLLCSTRMYNVDLNLHHQDGDKDDDDEGGKEGYGKRRAGRIRRPQRPPRLVGGEDHTMPHRDPLFLLLLGWKLRCRRHQRWQ